MKKTYVYQANRTKIEKLTGLIFPLITIFFVIFFMLVHFDIIDINNEFIDKEQINNIIMLIIGILGVYYSSYRLLPPRLQIDSLNNLLIYLGKRVHYSTKLENIHHFNYLDEDNTKDLRMLMQGGFLTKNMKELQALEPKFFLTKYWWLSNFFIISITTMVIIFSIFKLLLWFFNQLYL